MIDSQSRSGEGEGGEGGEKFLLFIHPKTLYLWKLAKDLYILTQTYPNKTLPFLFFHPPPPHELYAPSNFARVTMHVYFDNNYQLNCTFLFFLFTESLSHG